MSADLECFSDATPGELPSGVWTGLLQHAIRLVDDIHQHGIKDPFWTFGGGTVLMLRYRHRMSKDIDIFVPDPQYLGFVSPRLKRLQKLLRKNCGIVGIGCRHAIYLMCRW